MVAEATAPATPTRRVRRVPRRPTWWTVRALDPAAGTYEVAGWTKGCPVNWHTVTVDGATGAVGCTCRSAHEGFRYTRRGWCNHIEALMRACLQGRGPVRIDAERLTWWPLCRGCRPLCRSYTAELRHSV